MLNQIMRFINQIEHPSMMQVASINDIYLKQLESEVK